MRLAEARLKNFRLLKDAATAIDPNTTVIVGRNNSGKTSLTELFRRLLSGGAPSFALEDFSLSAHDQFWEAYQLFCGGADEDAVRAALPAIEIRLTIEYDSADADLGALSDFVIDLDLASTTAIVVMCYRFGEGQQLKSLFGETPVDERDSADVDAFARELMFRTLRERVPRLFTGVVDAVDPGDESNRRRMEWSRLHDLVQVGFINAQRGLDDTTDRDRRVLSRIVESLFQNAQSDAADPQDQATAAILQAAVSEMQEHIGGRFDTHLKKLMPALSQFGYPGLADPGLSTETTLEIDRLLADNTKVRYLGANGISLPESYNGLGTRNLIYILLALLQFYKEFQSRETSAGVHLVFIEEPEAHLHPQMQEVFIRQIEEIASVFARIYTEDTPWPVQFIVTTHSAHVANEARFDATRYFVAKPEGSWARTEIKDLSVGMSGVPEEDAKFLHQYMTLTRCDLLFADKAVLIEGTSERLLFRSMVHKFDESRGDEARLSSQYISVIEVGGAFAHRFFDLLRFLELQTLVITDIDSIGPHPSREACKVSIGTSTSNACIKQWFTSAVTPQELLVKSAAQKTSAVGYLAYQVPEVDGGPCGRSFEDAFMLANRGLCSIEGEDDAALEEVAWTRSRDVKKSEFALKYAITTPDWVVPRYISEGLLWLAGATRVGGVAETRASSC